jgi:hypothetical protein
MLTTYPLLLPGLRKSRIYTSSHPNAPLWSVTGPLYLFMCKSAISTLLFIVMSLWFSDLWIALLSSSPIVSLYLYLHLSFRPQLFISSVMWIWSSKILVTTYKAAWCHNPENHISHCNCHEKQNLMYNHFVNSRPWVGFEVFMAADMKILVF